MDARDSMVQRMAQQRPTIGASPGGMQTQAGMPPTQMAGQQPSGQAPLQGESQVKPLLDQAFNIIVQGNPADLAVLGDFMNRIQDLVNQHESMAQQGQPQVQGQMQPPVGASA